jgi:hypothetical protein
VIVLAISIRNPSIQVTLQHEGDNEGIIEGIFGKSIPVKIRYNEIVNLVFSEIGKRNKYWNLVFSDIRKRNEYW